MWTLRCAPAGGSHPHPAAACAELAADAAGVTGRAAACRVLEVRGAPRAAVMGQVNGRPVDRLLRPGCGRAFEQLHVLLTGG